MLPAGRRPGGSPFSTKYEANANHPLARAAIPLNDAARTLMSRKARKTGPTSRAPNTSIPRAARQLETSHNSHTKGYLAHRTAEGKAATEIIRTHIKQNRDAGQPCRPRV
jgi:hypothetical protein